MQCRNHTVHSCQESLTTILASFNGCSCCEQYDRTKSSQQSWSLWRRNSANCSWSRLHLICHVPSMTAAACPRWSSSCLLELIQQPHFSSLLMTRCLGFILMQLCRYFVALLFFLFFISSRGLLCCYLLLHATWLLRYQNSALVCLRGYSQCQIYHFRGHVCYRCGNWDLALTFSFSLLFCAFLWLCCKILYELGP